MGMRTLPAMSNPALEKTHVLYSSDGVHFAINQRYEIVQVLGKGLYGTVCLAIDIVPSTYAPGDCKVAIKKVSNIFTKEVLMKRAVRELKLLRHFRGHRNVCIFIFLFD